MVTAQERQRTALTEGLVRRPAYDRPRRDGRWRLEPPIPGAALTQPLESLMA